MKKHARHAVFWIELTLFFSVRGRYQNVGEGTILPALVAVCVLFSISARGVVTSRHPPAHCGSPQHPGELDTTVPAPRPRTDSGRFIDTINPLLSFSSEDMEIMDQEVEALCADDDDSESEAEIAIRSPVLPIVEPDSSSSDSLTGMQLHMLIL